MIYWWIQMSIFCWEHDSIADSGAVQSTCGSRDHPGFWAIYTFLCNGRSVELFRTRARGPCCVEVLWPTICSPAQKRWARETLGLGYWAEISPIHPWWWRIRIYHQAQSQQQTGWRRRHTGWCPNWNTSLHHQIHGLYKAVIEVYDILKDIQGKTIPQLFASVTITSCSSPQGSNEYLDIPGILLQYINGFPLTAVAAHAPKETWQSLCEEAIQIVHLMNDRGTLNQDVKKKGALLYAKILKSLNYLW